jgi:serine phosphatase RsbU (regulator of sigma subunit)
MTSSYTPERTRLYRLIDSQRRELDGERSAASLRSVLDRAIGMLMERFGCSAAAAAEHLARLSEEVGISRTELAADITGQPLRGTGALTSSEDPLARWDDAAPDGSRFAAAMLGEALRPAGAVAVAIWLLASDGGLGLAGQAGFGLLEASRWRRIPPGMRVPAAQVILGGTEIWWPHGAPPEHDLGVLIGGAADNARAVVPFDREGRAVGALEVCWPAGADIPAGASRLLHGLADMAGRTLDAADPDGTALNGSSAWLFGLLELLCDAALFVQPSRDEHGPTDALEITWATGDIRDPAGRSAEEVVGHQLIETYPEAASAGGLFDNVVDALKNGRSLCLPRLKLTSAGHVTDVRIAPMFGGAVVAWRDEGRGEGLPALLEHAQWLGRVGTWEEHLRNGTVRWSEPTFALFGIESGNPVRISELGESAFTEDLPAVHAFQDRLLRYGQQASAVFRIVRSDDDSVRQLRAFAEPVLGPAGDVIALRGAYQDVSAEYHTQVAFEVAREQLADAETRADEEHRLALRLQRAITPLVAQPVEVPGLETVARYRPAGSSRLVGGDWYDVAMLPNRNILLAVGDMAGHGIGAVTGMVTLRNFLRGLAVTGAGPATLLGWLNSATCHLAEFMFATAICGIYDPETQILRWAQAGHLPPLLVRDGAAHALRRPFGALLGADAQGEYQEATKTLRQGDTVLLYTDGLIERKDQGLDEAVAQLTKLASQPSGTGADLVDNLLATSASDTGDDTCVVSITMR